MRVKRAWIGSSADMHASVTALLVSACDCSAEGSARSERKNEKKRRPEEYGEKERRREGEEKKSRRGVIARMVGK